ncbi:hypothetical protein [Neoroseomonas soli]|uniref:Uncharacterized protein n=1 Tax=Neoroseomonas soli TaxID=1081025 RepID=A0A9X9WXN7_9PROT|nr:hypothetical protein [Neoroseomonas soli]MBR0671916.1 hypothetical protein [Neoroseomonas soli]
MDTGPWNRRFVHDLLFATEGSGWHEPELKDSIGFRWSGPGYFSILRVPAPAGAGRGEAHLLLSPSEPLPAVVVFLNGRRLEVMQRRLGTFGVLDFAWDAAAMAGEARAEFWFHAERLQRLPAPGERMRSVGFRLSTLAIEPAAAGPAPAGEALALIAGSRFLRDRLHVAAGRPRLAFRSDGEARLLEMRLEGARLGPSAQPHLTLALRATADVMDLALAAPGRPALALHQGVAGRLALPEGLSPRDRLLVARLLATLPEAFGRWLDEAMTGAAPDAELLAFWRRGLARLARGGEGFLAAALADGPDPFAEDPALPFAWPAQVPG